MKHWLKKKLQQLSDMLNADEHAKDSDVDNNEDLSNVRHPSASRKNVPQNIEELKELTIGAIGRTIKILGYANTVVSQLVLHSRYADNAVESVALQYLTKDDEFLKQIKRTFQSQGVRYNENLSIVIRYRSDMVNNVTHIAEGIGVEVWTPSSPQGKLKAKLVATEGITWEPDYILESNNKTYFIGRCRYPKIGNEPTINNDIAFVGMEEKNEEVYKINNYVSRSHAYIVFDKEMGAFKLFRSKFLNNPSHKIKIYNKRLNDFSGLSITQSMVPHTLRDGDAICFNDKIVLEFYIID